MVNYLTIRSAAREGYESIAHEANIDTWPLRGEGSNCFSITQLVGQKKATIKLANAS